MMRTKTRFHADQARRHVGQPYFDLTTRPLLPQHNRAAFIQPDEPQVIADLRRATSSADIGQTSS
jgi:hypothetical protein